jgi:5'(3')-deoxyribonucleotidase
MSLERPRILCDVDGVLADFLTEFLEFGNTLTGVRYKKEDIKKWDIFKISRNGTSLAILMKKIAKSVSNTSQIPDLPQGLKYTQVQSRLLKQLKN